MPPTVQPSSWHECPDGQNAFDCPKLLDSYSLQLKNRYFELRVHIMAILPQLLRIDDNFIARTVRWDSLELKSLGFGKWPSLDL